MLEKDYDILYYKTPIKYRTFLDGEGDPKIMEILAKEQYLEELLLKCSLIDLITFIIKALKERYANLLPIWAGIVDYERSTKKETPKRKDMNKLKFDFRYGVTDDFGANTEYLDNLYIELVNVLPNLQSSVKKALQGKIFTETSQNNKTVFILNNSPILKIEVTPSTFHMFIDKNSFIDYGQ